MKYELVMAALCVMATESAGAADERREVESVVEHYARAADGRDATEMARLLHDQFRVAAIMGGKLVVLAKSDYLGALKAGKIGGETRALKIDGVTLSGEYAFANATLSAKDRVFLDRLVLYRDATGWRILQNSAQVQSKG